MSDFLKLLMFLFSLTFLKRFFSVGSVFYIYIYIYIYMILIIWEIILVSIFVELKKSGNLKFALGYDFGLSNQKAKSILVIK